MSTTRTYWIQWTCVFQDPPDNATLMEKQKLLRKYVLTYLSDLKKSKLKGFAKAGPNETYIWNEKELKWSVAGDGKNVGSKALGGSKANIKWDEPWKDYLHEEWSQVNISNVNVYSYRAYFINAKALRIASNPTDGKGTMNPPPPPPPPGEC